MEEVTKYCNGSYEECAEVIQKYVKAARIDLLRFFRLIVFNFISLNDDAHLKNFSLINRGNEYRLSPAYDLINTSLHLTEPRIFALDKGLFKGGMNLGDKLIKRELDEFVKEKPLVQVLIDRSFLSEELKKQYRMSMGYRCKMLSF